MNIQPINYNSNYYNNYDYNKSYINYLSNHSNKLNGCNVSMRGKKIDFFDKLFQKLLNLLPEKTVKNGPKKIEQWNKIDNVISSPMWNRAIMGATALITQPTIDYYNSRVDEDTRVVSRNRTIAKILAGTLVGMFVVRGPLHKFAQGCTNLNGKTKLSQLLLPKDYINDMKKNPKLLDNYRAALAMMMVLFANLFTNFLIDAPLTTKIANKLNKMSGKNLEMEVKNE